MQHFTNKYYLVFLLVSILFAPLNLVSSPNGATEILGTEATTSLSTFFAPVVWSEPAFPSQFDSVTIFFDATQGNGALAGYDGIVYAHAGVITNQSTHPGDWKHVIGEWGTADVRTQMKKVEENIYSLTYHIPTFYGINDGEAVLQLAFVFRNQSGSLVGRNADGSDIFIDVYPPDQGLFINLRAPSNPGSIIYQGDSLLVDLQLSARAHLLVSDNGATVFDDSTMVATIYLHPELTGNHEIEITASNADTSLTIRTSYIVLAESQPRIDPPANTINGINYFTDSTYIFQLTAPGKPFTFFLCPANEFQVNDDFQMHQSENGDIFWLELRKDQFLDGKNTYQYLLDNNIRIADPFSKVVLDPVHDPFLAAEIKMTLPVYPEGLTTGVVTTFDLENTTFSWREIAFNRPAPEKLVIYELLLRDFLEDHSFTSLRDTLAYFKKLGVNAIELMPVNEFEGNISWGYNPSFHMALDKYYGSRTDLQAFIDEAHVQGISVILDVVFNHAFSQSPLAQMYWDAANFQPASDNPYLNVTARHPFNVGYDFNHESPYTKQWVKQILTYWIDEFKLDGFRFDLSKGLTQTNSGNNAGLMAQYDASRIQILKDYADHIWTLDSGVYAIMEHFAENDEEQELADYGMLLWGNMNHSFTEAASGRVSNLGGADYTKRDWSKPHLIAYMESHDEERMMFNLLRRGESEADYNTRNFSTALKRIALASSIFYLLPGPKMLWQFGELGQEFSINRCVNGTIDNGCRLDPKPIRWDYVEDPERADLKQTIAAILHLRNNFPTFSTRDFDFQDGNLYIKSIHFRHAEMDALVISNFRVTSSNVIPGFAYEGVWYDYFSGDSLVINDLQSRIDLGPGEFRIYTSEKINLPDDFITSTSERSAAHTLQIYPNLASPGEAISIEMEGAPANQQFELWSTSGQRIPVDQESNGKLIFLKIPQSISSGIYFIKTFSKKGNYFGKIMVQ